MPYVKRDAKGQVLAVSLVPGDGCDEFIDDDSAELQPFLMSLGLPTELAHSDLEFIRVLDDVIEVLLEKNLLLFTELPDEAQRKIAERNRLRSLRRGSLDILDSEKLF